MKVRSKFRVRSENHREFGWRWNRAPYRPLVQMYACNRYFGNGSVKRLRPMLNYECRREGGYLWSRGSNYWRTPFQPKEL